MFAYAFPCVHTHKDTQYCTKYIFKVNVSQYDIKREKKPATIELPIWPIYIFAVFMCLIRGSTLQNDSVHIHINIL